MYIQITTRCNMLCAHCCFRCTARGTDMDRDTFVAAARIAYDRGMTVTIGGGEPTLHPLLFDFIGIAAAHCDDLAPYVITNGKKKREALQLASLADRKIIGAELSQDQYHELADSRVIESFGRQNLRNNTQILKTGRALDNGLWTTEDSCACEDLFVSPNGKVWQCGHKEKQFGTVFRLEAMSDDAVNGRCSKKPVEIEELMYA